jgi:RimJ/RimL family protein N-acetyltransferase
VTRLYAVVDPENTKSVRVLEGVGFRFERPIALGGDTKEISLFVRGGQEELGR